MDNVEDNQLISKILNGDSIAFGRLVDKYKDIVFTIASRILKNDADAEEVSQDSFLKVYDNLKDFQGNSSLKTWLYRIVYTTAISRLRKVKLNTTPIDSITERQMENAIDNLNNAIVSLADEERKRFLTDAINSLSSEEAVIITLYYLNENTVKEISEVIGLESSNIKIKLFRARKRMYEELQRSLNHEMKTLL